MAKIHLLVGFMGFGKTTLAKRLAKDLPAVRLTHDDFMLKLFGRIQQEKEFRINYQIIDNLLWDLAEKIIEAGSDVIMDYGFWSVEKRREAYTKAKKFCSEIIFHELLCDMNIAEQRVLNRSISEDALAIDKNCFNQLAIEYQPMTEDENYNIIRHAQDK